MVRQGCFCCQGLIPGVRPLRLPYLGSDPCAWRRYRARVLDIHGYGFNRDDLPEPPDARITDLNAHFGLPPGPLELEIGSGKGTFLAQHAPLHPDTAFLGIEWTQEYFKLAADRLRRHALPNARVLWHDAMVFLRQNAPDAAFRVIHLYFPDPWPKARHHKRRTFALPFLKEAHRVLEPAGTVRVVTDHADYFAWMEEHAAAAVEQGLFHREPFKPLDSAGDGEWVGTNFERKYRVEGRTFNGMVLHRR